LLRAGDVLPTGCREMLRAASHLLCACSDMLRAGSYLLRIEQLCSSGHCDATAACRNGKSRASSQA